MATTLIASSAQPASLLDRARAIPGVTQLALLIGLAAAIAGGLSLFTWAQKPADQALFAGLPEAETAAMADALAAEGIVHRIDSATGALTVPVDQVRNARLKLAGRGLPKSAASGFESMQGDQGFGVSQSVESARMQHALETELMRTITSIQAVKSARVHLAVPKPSAFTRAGGTASASVFVELHPGRNLTSQQVQSIIHMVASSVADMQPSAVTVVDQTGRLLTDESSHGAGMGSSQFEQIKRIEDGTRHRVEDILTPLVGEGRVKTQVVAALDFTVEEQTQEQFTPDANAIRSEQTSEDVNRSGALKAQGVPGATSNKPPEPGVSAPALSPPPATTPADATAAVPAGASVSTATAELPSAQTKTSTRNYELNRTLSSRKTLPGRIERLSVAVLVDYLPKPDAKGVAVPTALTKDELARIESLVKEAMGFDAKRGDTVTVQNAAFVLPVPEAIAAPLPLIERPEVHALARQGIGALVLLVLILAVVRPLLKSLFAPPPAPAPMLVGSQLPALAPPQDGDEGVSSSHGEKRHAAIPLAPQGPSPYEQKLALARETVKQDPKKVAQVMKAWIAAEQ